MMTKEEIEVILHMLFLFPDTFGITFQRSGHQPWSITLAVCPKCYEGVWGKWWKVEWESMQTFEKTLKILPYYAKSESQDR